jgi:hypothetical protein
MTAEVAAEVVTGDHHDVWPPVRRGPTARSHGVRVFNRTISSGFEGFEVSV